MIDLISDKERKDLLALRKTLPAKKYRPVTK